MQTQVSILVPIYNVSPFIERCAHSLFRQTFQDIEYVFVNDCTPDDSMQKLLTVLEQYPQRREQVKIINHSVNQGLAATRNTAIDNSTGKYLLQIDSDDYVEINIVELLYNKAEETQADVTVCDFFEEQKNTTKIVVDAVSKNMDENRCNIIISTQSHACVWNKLIKRDLYNRCSRLPKRLDVGEDNIL